LQVSGQPQTPVTLPPGKNPGTLWTWGCKGHRNVLDFWRSEALITSTGIRKLVRPDRCLLTIPT